VSYIERVIDEAEAGDGRDRVPETGQPTLSVMPGLTSSKQVGRSQKAVS
jgi:hypothetical protein